MNTGQPNQKQVLVEEIIDSLSEEDIRGKIEILANVFLTIGVGYTNIDADKSPKRLEEEDKLTFPSETKFPSMEPLISALDVFM